MTSLAHAPEESRVSARAASYLAEVENGEAPDPRRYVQDLTEAEQREFAELIEVAAWTKSHLPAALAPQRVLANRYLLIETLGVGGFGQVWRAHDRTVGRDVAVKVMSLVARAAGSARSVFEQERHALAQLDHEGIVGILDAGEDDGMLFLVTELVRGHSAEQIVTMVRTAAAGCAPTLDDLRRALVRPQTGDTVRPLVARDYAHAVANICVDVLRALESVHACGIVHRDIKPANVMLTAGGRPKVLDFGIAAVKDLHVGITSRLVGTENYMAPEQLKQLRVGRDPRTDVYQAGLLLYELLCLRPAFGNSAALTLFDAIRAGRYARPRTLATWLPVGLEDICLRAMEPVPERRYQSAAAFAEDLERWVAGETPIASRAGGLGRAGRSVRRFVRRHRGPVALASALVVGMVAGGVWLARSPVAGLARVVAFDPAAGTASVEVNTEQAVVFTLVARAPHVATPTHLRPVQVAVEGGQPAWSVRLPAGHSSLRVITPPEFWPAQSEARVWELRALGFAASALADAEATWSAFGAPLVAAAEEPGHSPAQARHALDATATRGGSTNLGVSAAELLRRLTEQP